MYKERDNRIFPILCYPLSVLKKGRKLGKEVLDLGQLYHGADFITTADKGI